MFLTRLGYGSKAVVTGDVTQVDLPSGRGSGLIEVQKVLRGVEGVSFCPFSEVDVVRHPLVQEVVRAYDAYEAERRSREAPPAGGEGGRLQARRSGAGRDRAPPPARPGPPEVEACCHRRSPAVRTSSAVAETPDPPPPPPRSRSPRAGTCSGRLLELALVALVSVASGWLLAPRPSWPACPAPRRSASPRRGPSAPTRTTTSRTPRPPPGAASRRRPRSGRSTTRTRARPARRPPASTRPSSSCATRSRRCTGRAGPTRLDPAELIRRYGAQRGAFASRLQLLVRDDDFAALCEARFSRAGGAGAGLAGPARPHRRGGRGPGPRRRRPRARLRRSAPSCPARSRASGRVVARRAHPRRGHGPRGGGPHRRGPARQGAAGALRRAGPAGQRHGPPDAGPGAGRDRAPPRRGRLAGQAGGGGGEARRADRRPRASPSSPATCWSSRACGPSSTGATWATSASAGRPWWRCWSSVLWSFARRNVPRFKPARRDALLLTGAAGGHAGAGRGRLHGGRRAPRPAAGGAAGQPRSASSSRWRPGR